MSRKQTSIWYAKIVLSSEPPRVIRALLKSGFAQTAFQANMLLLSFSLLGFVAAWVIFVDAITPESRPFYAATQGESFLPDSIDGF